jgi:two-component system, chemotaxis family, response regulator WspF
VRVALVHRPGPALDALKRTLDGEGHELAWSVGDPLEAARCARDGGSEVVLWAVELTRGERALSALQEAASALPVIAIYQGEQGLADADLALARGAALALDVSSLGIERLGEFRARLDAARRLRLRRSLPARGLSSLVAIGASTGGPQALSQLCAGLPADFAGAIVVVQHIEAIFADALVDTLSQHTELGVHAAEEGMMPKPGAVCIATRADHHLVLGRDLRFHYTRDPVQTIHRPSIDVLFESLAKHWHKAGTAVLLTGMGKDGARGMALLRKSGWRTIAQDERSSVVYGMPRAALDLGGAGEVLGIGEIAPALLRRSR